MIRKIALVTSAAGLFMAAAPVMAQDAAAPATQVAPAAQPQSLTLQPGSDVKGSDGAVLGKLVGVRTVAAGQELTVRGADGKLKGVPLAGLRPDGTGVAVGWSTAEFQAAEAIAEPASAAPTGGSAAAPTGDAPATPQPEEATQSPQG